MTMGHGGDLEGTPVSEGEVAMGLGFKSISDMRLFYMHIGPVQQIVDPILQRVFGAQPQSQWCFEVSSKVTEYFIEVLRSK